jgi:hypothetical protein
LTNCGTWSAGVEELAVFAVLAASADLFFHQDQAMMPSPMTAIHTHVGSGPSLWVSTFPPPPDEREGARSGAASLIGYPRKLRDRQCLVCR